MRRQRRSQAGVSAIELVIGLAVVGFIVLATLNFSKDWLGREEVRGGIYSIQSALHLAQAQAVSRNRACRFLINSSSRQLQVVDLNDPASTTDDIVITSEKLPSKIQFAKPGGGSTVTLELHSGTTYRTTFGADGSATAGAGAVYVRGGDRYYRVQVYGAGGTRVESWTGSAWQKGS